jgi:uncharacterized protein YhbP (UPF0306 family)
MAPGDRARSLMERADLMTLATSDEAGVPWVSPVFYVPDDAYNLFWVSAKDARHSENIQARATVAIVIYSTEPEVDAVYLSAEAEEIAEEDDAQTGAEIMRRKPQPEKWIISVIADVIGDGPLRIYKALPTSIEVRREVRVDGKAVVTREPADFR